jgi:hypothetical protein
MDQVVLTQTLSAGLTYLGSSGSFMPTVAGRSLVWDLGTLPAGRWGELTVTARIAEQVSLGWPLTSVVSISSSESEADLSNNMDVLIFRLGDTLPVASVPFVEHFDAPFPADSWEFSMWDGGQVEFTDRAAHVGAGGMRLGYENTGGDYPYATAVLNIDLSGQEPVYLDFWWKRIGPADEENDAIYLSVDEGYSWYTIFTFGAAAGDFQHERIDLAAVAEELDIALNSHVQLIFDCYGSETSVTENLYIDEVSVAGESSLTYMYLPMLMR